MPSRAAISGFDSPSAIKSATSAWRTVNPHALMTCCGVSRETSASVLETGTAGADCCTQYSIVVTFALIALVLAFRPQGLFGRPG